MISANDLKVGYAYYSDKNISVISKSADASEIRGIPNKPFLGYSDTRSIEDDSDTSALVYPGTACDYSHLPDNPALFIEAGEPFEITFIEPDYTEIGNYLLIVNFKEYSNLRIVLSGNDLFDMNILDNNK